ncbi:MAG TPA: ribose-phosphate pyrophosphokinase [Rhodocyclaceae bacterium]|nr:ribose-phosphate pyrophosphokinase [Rhodocyclaceae bacterium]
MDNDKISLFALNSSRAFGERVGRSLGLPLSEHEEREFEDGEHKSRPLVSVRGRDVYVLQSLYQDRQLSVNDKLCRLLFFIGALVDASAKRVTAVIPYLCYARKELKTQPRDPVTTRYIAALFEAVGTHRVVALDVHNVAAFQNAFRCHTDHLEARKLFAGYFSALLHGQQIVVVSPDVGGIKRAERLRQALSLAAGEPVPIAFMEKQRSKGVVTGDALVGNVAGRAAIIIDDLISTGTTMARAANACSELGATKVYAAATHGIFVGEAPSVLANPVLETVVVTDSIPPFRLGAERVAAKLVVLDSAALFAEAIKRIHGGGSITELLESRPGPPL